MSGIFWFFPHHIRTIGATMWFMPDARGDDDRLCLSLCLDRPAGCRQSVPRTLHVCQYPWVWTAPVRPRVALPLPHPGGGRRTRGSSNIRAFLAGRLPPAGRGNCSSRGSSRRVFHCEPLFATHVGVLAVTVSLSLSMLAAVWALKTAFVGGSGSGHLQAATPSAQSVRGWWKKPESA